MTDADYTMQEATIPPPEIVDDTTPLVEKLSSYGTVAEHHTHQQKKAPPPAAVDRGDQEAGGVAPNVAYIQSQPTDHVTAAWLVTLLCFFPVGLCALYFGRRTRREYQAGQLRTARRCSRRARCLVQVAVAFGMITWFIGLVAAVIVYQDKTSQ